MTRKITRIALSLLLTVSLTACGSSLKLEVERLQSELDAANLHIQEITEEAAAEQSRLEAEKQMELEALQSQLDDAEATNAQLLQQIEGLEKAIEEQAARASANTSAQSQPQSGSQGTTVAQPSSQPQPGSRKMVDGQQYVYVEGFGWLPYANTGILDDASDLKGWESR